MLTLRPRGHKPRPTGGPLRYGGQIKIDTLEISCTVGCKLKEVAKMGMTDRQFDSYTEAQIFILKQALAATPENAILKEYIEKLEASLKRP